MKQGYTHWAILIDRSSSMNSIKSAVIEGFNQSVEEQKSEPGELTVSLVQFDQWYDEMGTPEGPFSRNWNSLKLQYNQINDFATLDKVQLLTESNFQPRGNTPLNDAVARFIEETGRRLAAMPESFRPEKVIVTIMTDGQENASKTHTRESVRKMIEEQEQKYGWKFIYIGANQDSFVEGNTRGISNTLNYSADLVGTKSAFFANSKSLKSMRSMSSAMYKTYNASTDMLKDYQEEVEKEKNKK